MGKSQAFRFDGGAGSYLGVGIMAVLVTLGIYSFWVMPRLQKWIVENTDFAPHGQIPSQQQGQHAQQS